MVATVHNHGKAQIKISSGTGGALEILGYTRNGADVSEEGFWIDVPGDENGGDAGDPIDIQYIGEMARVRLELTKFDVAVLDKIHTRYSTAGFPKIRGQCGNVGLFMFLNNVNFRLVINTAVQPMNFPRAVPRAPTQRNMGTRFTMAIIEFDCYKSEAGIIYDSNVG